MRVQVDFQEGGVHKSKRVGVRGRVGGRGGIWGSPKKILRNFDVKECKIRVIPFL